MSVTVAITRRVRPGREKEFEERLRAFIQRSLAAGGVLGANILVPPPGSRDYGILRTFADAKERDAFYESALFQAWEMEVAPLVEGDPHIRDMHGLEAWFHQNGEGRPPRWKMAAVTLLGVYPLSLLLPWLIYRIVGSQPRWLFALLVSSAMVASLTWLVMPKLVHVLEPWLKAPRGKVS